MPHAEMMGGKCKGNVTDAFDRWTFCFAVFVQFPPQLTSVFFPSLKKSSVLSGFFGLFYLFFLVVFFLV